MLHSVMCCQDGYTAIHTSPFLIIVPYVLSDVVIWFLYQQGFSLPESQQQQQQQYEYWNTIEDMTMMCHHQWCKMEILYIYNIYI